MDTQKLILISDTHCYDQLTLPRALLEAIGNCDQIIHAGDITSLEAYETLRTLAPLTAVRGNTDAPSLQAALPELATLEVLGHHIAVAHGWGPPSGLIKRISARFDPAPFDLLVFGHSHYPEITGHGNCLFVNPGSPVDRRYAPYISYAQVEITQEGIGTPEIIRLE